MESVTNYFTAYLFTGCGIHSITLEGTTNDWIKLKENAIFLKKYSIESWIDNLIPILDQFIQASKGQIDRDFWKKIYKYRNEYSPAYVTGWIVKFFPYYLKHYQISNSQEEYAYEKYEINPFYEGDKYLTAELEYKNFPKGLSSFEFKWTDLITNLNYEMKLQAGFIGLEQDSLTFSLKPVITWVVFDKNEPNIVNYDD